MLTPKLSTERLVLRPPAHADLPSWQRYFDDWQVIQQLSTDVPWPYPEDGVAEHWDLRVRPGLQAGTSWHWAITERQRPSMLIGTIDLTPGEAKRGHRGFWLGRPFWGRGYMTEAITAVQDWVFTHTKMPEILVMNARSNSSSRRIKEKTGAEFLRTETAPHNSGDTDSEVWVVRREAWLQLRGL